MYSATSLVIEGCNTESKECLDSLLSVTPTCLRKNQFLVAVHTTQYTLLIYARERDKSAYHFYASSQTVIRSHKHVT